LFGEETKTGAAKKRWKCLWRLQYTGLVPRLYTHYKCLADNQGYIPHVITSNTSTYTFFTSGINHQKMLAARRGLASSHQLFRSLELFQTRLVDIGSTCRWASTEEQDKVGPSTQAASTDLNATPHFSMSTDSPTPAQDTNIEDKDAQQEGEEKKEEEEEEWLEEWNPITPYEKAAKLAGFRPLNDLPMPSFIQSKQSARRPAVPLPDAIFDMKQGRRRKFDEGVDLDIKLNIDPRKGDQMVRGIATLPHGLGRTIKVAVFAQQGSEAAEAARVAGAHVVGGEDLIEQILKSGGGAIDFDRAIATPDMMSKMGKIARILGPKGLMPNPKLGTITNNVTQAVADMQKGQVEFRADKYGLIHAGVGRRSFTELALAENTGALVAAILAARPKAIKHGSGVNNYVLGASLSSTMGPGIAVTVGSLASAADGMRGK
jgi:ribosomal protein L1